MSSDVHNGALTELDGESVREIRDLLRRGRMGAAIGQYRRAKRVSWDAALQALAGELLRLAWQDNRGSRATGMLESEVCPDCGAEEGRLHELGCDLEVCPWCGGQFAGCDCAEDAVSEEEFVERLGTKGRIPFLVYPVACARCREVRDELFMVPVGAWEPCVEGSGHWVMLCADCSKGVKHMIEEHGGAHRSRTVGAGVVGAGRSHDLG